MQGKDNNLLNSLSGKIAGVRITNTQGDVGSSRIVIRGETSIAGENQPLLLWMESQWIIRSLMHVPADVILKMQ